MRSTPAVNAHSWLGSSFLDSPSNGPAATWRTCTPGASSTIGGWSDDVALVKISTATPRCAIRTAVCSM